MNKQVPVYGMHCRDHVGDTQIMNCRECKVLWSPCCETHKCQPESLVVQCSGDLAHAIPEGRIFKRGTKVKITIPPPGSVGWAGWET